MRKAIMLLVLPVLFGFVAWQPCPDSNDISSADSGIVIAKADEFTTNTPDATHAWASAGSNAMLATPNDGALVYEDIEQGPRLDYQRNFIDAGIYYIWVRGWGATGADDSLHVGINGVVTAQAISSFEPGGSWSNRQMDGGQAMLTIPEPGKHTINVWMREDGFLFDLIILTTDSEYIP